MIKINIDQSQIDLLVKQHWRALIAPPYQVYKSLVGFSTKTPSQDLLILFLIRNYKRIIIAKPSELQQLAYTLKPLFDNVLIELKASLTNKEDKTKVVKDYKDSLLNIFNYKKFTGLTTGYNSYVLADALKVDVCPYCNRQYTFTLNTKTGKTRPEFDHFFSKSSYPFFALSFYNLIPSCHICNSNLKGAKEIQHNTHLNPYDSCFDQVLKFTINVTKADFINGVKKDYSLSLKPFSGADASLIKKAKKNAEIFKHDELYAQHKDLVSELIKRAYYYTGSKIAELEGLKDGNDNRIFINKEEVKRFITGVYTETSDLGKRPMSKLIRDISEELGLI